MINLSSPEFASFIAHNVDGFKDAENHQWVYATNLPSSGYKIQVQCWCSGPKLVPFDGCPSLPEGMGFLVLLERYSFKINDQNDQEYTFEAFLGRCRKCGRVFCGKI